jgi:hypothetical protein
MMTKNEKRITVACFIIAGTLLFFLLTGMIPFYSEAGIISFFTCYGMSFSGLLLIAATRETK